MTTYDRYAAEYDRGRNGYANDIYNILVAAGLSQSTRILDIGCGTGIASRPLIDNGFKLTGVDPSESMLAIARAYSPSATWVAGSAEKLPFPDRSFGAAISAQTFHHVDRAAAIAEIIRVLQPGGLVAIWWKRLMGDDPVKLLRDQVTRDLGTEPPQSGLAGGFKEFYAAPLLNQTLRVVPWRAVVDLKQYLEYERSRDNIRVALGGRVDEYFAKLESRLRGMFGDGNPMIPLSYMHYLYLAKTE